jgi:hypothetical protein
MSKKGANVASMAAVFGVTRQALAKDIRASNTAKPAPAKKAAPAKAAAKPAPAKGPRVVRKVKAA